MTMTPEEEIVKLDSIVDALHARIATLEAQVAEAHEILDEAGGIPNSDPKGGKWSLRARLLMVTTDCDVFEKAFMREKSRADAAQWQTFAMAWECIGWMVAHNEPVATHADLTAALARAAAAEREGKELGERLAAAEGVALAAVTSKVVYVGYARAYYAEDIDRAMDRFAKYVPEALDAARRATTAKCGARHLHGIVNRLVECKLDAGHVGDHVDGGNSWTISAAPAPKVNE